MDLANKTKEELLQRIQELESQLLSFTKPSGTYNMFSTVLESTTLLKNKFEEIQKKNPQFSLRAFAKKVEISPGKISDILKGQYLISREMAKKIAEKIDFENVQKTRFLDAVELENTNFEDYRNFSKSLAEKETFYAKELNPLQDDDEIQLLDHWTFYGMMAAFEIKDCDHTPAWLAQQMKLSEDVVLERLHIMIGRGIVEKKEDRYYLVPQSNFNNAIPASKRASQIAAQKCSISAFNYMANRFQNTITREAPDHDVQNNVYFFINAVDSSKIGNIPEFVAQSAYKSIEEMAQSPNRDAVYMVNISFLKV